MTLNNARRGFTLVELLVVIAMIALLMGAVTVSVSAASTRARVERARADVRAVSQAILGYENQDQGGGKYELPTMNKVEASASSLGFLLGKKTLGGEKVPVTLMAELRNDGKMRDPWGRPYYVTIRKGSMTLQVDQNKYAAGYFLPNLYRLSEGER